MHYKTIAVAHKVILEDINNAQNVFTEMFLKSDNRHKIDYDEHKSFFLSSGIFAANSFQAFLEMLEITGNHFNDSDLAHFSTDWKEYLFFEICFYKYMLVHIPKTSGRHIFSSYFVYRYGEKQNHITVKTKDYNTETGLSLIATKLDTGKMHTPGSMFAIVRNPFDWLVSMYFCNGSSSTNLIPDIISSICGDTSFEKFVNILYDNVYKDTTVYSTLNDTVFPFKEGMLTQIFDDNDILLIGNIIFFEKRNTLF